MKVEVWSDVMCPFCYIGKRRFENALDRFSEKDTVDVIYKSYQLMPDLITQPDKNHDEFLAEQKGISLTQAKAMNGHALQMAQQTGLTYHLDKAVPANTFRAHQLIHYAKTEGRQSLVKELLFRAHFTEGKNIDDMAILIELGKEAGLDEKAVKDILENGRFADDVHTDIYEARQVGVRGVPFFLFNGKYTISGAHESDVLLSALEQVKAEEEKMKGQP